MTAILAERLERPGRTLMANAPEGLDDLLLAGVAGARAPAALLQVPSPVLYAWLVGHGEPPAEHDNEVTRALFDYRFEPGRFEPGGG